MFENLAPRKGLAPQSPKVRFNHELRGGFAFAPLIPLIASAITAIPGIASAIIQAKQSS